MKKILVIFVVFISVVISANAQYCPRANGVQPSFEIYTELRGNAYQGVSFYNSNDVKVTVDVKVKIVFKDGREPQEFQRTFVIKPKSSYLDSASYEKALLKTGVSPNDVNLAKSSAEVLDCTRL